MMLNQALHSLFMFFRQDEAIEALVRVAVDVVHIANIEGMPFAIEQREPVDSRRD